MNRGFTLIEVLISIVVMTIAFFAVLAVQGSTLTGFASSRDITDATELANATIQIIQTESQSWREPPGGTPGLTLDTLTNTWANDAASPFQRANVLKAIKPAPIAAGDVAPWTWISITATPVNQALDTDANSTGRRFCIFARANFVPVDLTNLNTNNGGFAESPLLRLQIAVVYPGRLGNIAACTDVNTAQLDPANREALELSGLRVVEAATVVVRREGL